MERVENQLMDAEERVKDKDKVIKEQSQLITALKAETLKLTLKHKRMESIEKLTLGGRESSPASTMRKVNSA